MSSQCLICKLSRMEELIVARLGSIFVAHHPTPFNSGHLVIAPQSHLTIEEAGPTVLGEMLRVAREMTRALRSVYRPHGFNVGIFEGPHVNVQVVPRWRGDVNFMPLLFNTKVVPETPSSSVDKLRRVVSNVG